ncbi:hypothetical protein [Hydrogenophaga sp.]|uniref:hypothetical protein n=1 Tax=Hydrogenophaga sp. TaxID=1904254 RepID=UPI002FC98985
MELDPNTVGSLVSWPWIVGGSYGFTYELEMELFMKMAKTIGQAFCGQRIVLAQASGSES